MSLIVEDGTGLATAQSYASVADADTYFLARANATWAAANTTNKEAALVRGTAALDGMYGSKWPGVRVSSTQALDWPRAGAMSIDGYPLDYVPIEVKRGAMEAALIELGSAGALSESSAANIKSERTGPVATEYFGGSGASTIYNTIRQALARIVPMGGSIRMSRG